MRTNIPTNTTYDGCAYAVLARYDGAGITNLTGGGGHFPHTAVIVLVED